MKKTGLIVAILVAVVAVAAAAAVFFFSKGEADTNAQHAQTQETRQLTFAVTAPGYKAGVDGVIPLHASGVDVDGNAVEQDFYITPQDATIRLPQGGYTISVTASPLLSGGRLYALPAQDMEVVVGDKDLTADRSVLDAATSGESNGGDEGDVSPSAGSAEYTAALAITFTELSADVFTEEVIQASYDAAVAGGMAEGTAQSYMQADQAVIYEQQYHIPVGNFEFTVPQYWRGRTHIETDGATTYVVADFYTAEPLCEFRIVDSGSAFGTGSSAEWMLYYQDDGAGNRLELWVYGYPFLAWAAQYDPSVSALFPQTDVLHDLVDLSTGGSMTYQQARVADSGSIESRSTQAVEGFYTSSVIPTIRVK